MAMMLQTRRRKYNKQPASLSSKVRRIDTRSLCQCGDQECFIGTLYAYEPNPPQYPYVMLAVFPAEVVEHIYRFMLSRWKRMRLHVTYADQFFRGYWKVLGELCKVTDDIRQDIDFEVPWVNGYDYCHPWLSFKSWDKERPLDYETIYPQTIMRIRSADPFYLWKWKICTVYQLPAERGMRYPQTVIDRKLVR